MNEVNNEIDKLLNKTNKTKETTQKFSLDTIQEQIESPMTSIKCPESIDEKELKKVDKTPENYIQINFIKKIRIVDSFYIPSNLKEFSYDTETYNIVEENIYIQPTKKGYLIPTCFYREGKFVPIDFKQKNTGITGKALSLLYDVKLYVDLFRAEEGQYNLFVVIFLIISMSCFIVGLYFLLGGSV
jgi:hypothetical protein